MFVSVSEFFLGNSTFCGLCVAPCIGIHVGYIGQYNNIKKYAVKLVDSRNDTKIIHTIILSD